MFLFHFLWNFSIPAPMGAVMVTLNLNFGQFFLIIIFIFAKYNEIFTISINYILSLMRMFSMVYHCPSRNIYITISTPIGQLLIQMLLTPQPLKLNLTTFKILIIKTIINSDIRIISMPRQNLISILLRRIYHG